MSRAVTNFSHFVLLLIPIALTGCAGSQIRDVTESVDIDVVINRLKDEIGYYETQRANFSNVPPLQNACGGLVDFKIVQAKVTLVTTNTQDSSGNVSISVPVSATPGDLIGAGVSGNVVYSNTQTLVFYARPKRPVQFTPPSGFDPRNYQIANSLLGLRNALLKASDRKPCFELTPTKGGPLPSYEIEFMLTNKATMSANLKYTVIGGGVSSSLSNIASNKLTVTFEPVGNAAFMHPP